MKIEFPFAAAANIELAPDITLELTLCDTSSLDGKDWWVWGVRINGELYGEPHSLNPHPLKPCKLLEDVQEQYEMWRAGQRKHTATCQDNIFLHHAATGGDAECICRV